MRKLILILLLAGCVSEPRKAPKATPGPTIFVQIECEHGPGDHVSPQGIILDPDWPPTVCLGRED